MLSLAKVQFPRIGSLTINNHGVISLTNRPLANTLQQLDNCEIPTNIARDKTYTTADAYVSDLLACHDSRVRHMPSSIVDEQDGLSQLSALVMMRSLVRHFTDDDRNGSFFLMLTDLHQSNIFVTKDWHITAIIDLEWASVLPLSLQRPPHWIAGEELIDLIVEDKLQDLEVAHAEFTTHFEREEKSLLQNNCLHTQTMRRGWRIGSFWYFCALECSNGLWHLYKSHIQRRFARPEDSGPQFDRLVAPYWTPQVYPVRCR